MRILLALISLLIITNASAQSPDLILFNGKIFTSENPTSFVDALAIKGNKIQAAGKSSVIKRLARSNTKLVDLQGKTVIPGINDAHYHHKPYRTGRQIGYPHNGPEPEWTALKDSILNILPFLPKQSWLFGTMGIATGTDTSINRYLLDQLAPDHPVLLETYWGHGTVMNSAALKILHITDDAKDPPGGLYERNPETGIINGRLQEQAQLFGADNIFTNDELSIRSLRDLGEEAAAFGITTLQNMCTGATPEMYVRWLPAAAFPIRMRLIRWGKEDMNGELMSAKTSKLPRLTADDLYYEGGIKWMLDGTPIERLAAVRQAYNDKRYWKGILNYDASTIGQMISSGVRKKSPLHFHAVGDRTIQVLLQQLDLQYKNNPSRLQVRIEHGDGLVPDLYEAARRNKIIVVQNPSHLTIDSVMRSRWNGQLLQHGMALKSLIRAGIPVALGSDGPLNPYLNIMFACIHPVHPSEAITREEAVIAYTRTAALAEGLQQVKGTLRPGKLADLTVLSQDIFTIPLDALPATYSVLTMVNGKIVHLSH